jgi:hypothetical protein
VLLAYLDSAYPTQSAAMQKSIYLLIAALAFGFLVTYVDSRPNWDDTGVTAAAILLSCGLLGAAGPRQPWLWALAVGLWIPILGIVRTQNYASLLALGVAFIGAFAGMGLRRLAAS